MLKAFGTCIVYIHVKYYVSVRVLFQKCCMCI